MSDIYLNHHVGHIGDGVDKIRRELGVRLDAFLRHKSLGALHGRDEKRDVNGELTEQ